MDLIEGSETSANINQTLGIHPKIETVNTEHSESLKSRTASSVSGNRPFLGPVNFLRYVSHPLIAALCFRQSNVAFMNSKSCSGFAVSLLLWAPKNFTFELCRI
jgi:hypothetical protein